MSKHPGTSHDWKLLWLLWRDREKKWPGRCWHQAREVGQQELRDEASSGTFYWSKAGVQEEMSSFSPVHWSPASALPLAVRGQWRVGGAAHRGWLPSGAEDSHMCNYVCVSTKWILWTPPGQCLRNPRIGSKRYLDRLRWGAVPNRLNRKLVELSLYLSQDI